MVNINDSVFNPNSPLDMLEKDGVTFNAKHGSLSALPKNAKVMYE